MKKALYLLLLMVSFLFPSCKQVTPDKVSESSEVDMSILEQEIEIRLRDYENYLKKGDSIALGAMYMEDAEIIPSTVGRDEIIKVFSSLIKDSITNSRFETDHLWGNDQILVEEGTGEWLYENGEVAGRGKYLLVWQKDDGVWKILRDTWFPIEVE